MYFWHCKKLKFDHLFYYIKLTKLLVLSYFCILYKEDYVCRTHSRVLKLTSWTISAEESTTILFWFFVSSVQWTRLAAVLIQI